MKTRAELMREIRQNIRAPYAWPGGYPVHLVLSDGAMLCNDCTKSEYRTISEAAREPEYNTGWEPHSLRVLWETECYPDPCGHCGEPLESAYGVV